mmetsp:Transcript_47585/g.119932  ORF Transcript_47585/g.119932 Transcript_47585/m.119932 type:complete len:206 (+) Transcript_47585:23-640(+)
MLQQHHVVHASIQAANAEACAPSTTGMPRIPPLLPATQLLTTRVFERPPIEQLGASPQSSLLLGLSLHVLVVGRPVHEGGQVARELHLHQPPVRFRPAVDGGRLVTQSSVHFDDLAICRRVDLAHSLHALQRAEGLLALELRALVGQVAIDDLTELPLGEVGDAEDADIALHAHPLVGLRELEVREGTRKHGALEGSPGAHRCRR